MTSKRVEVTASTTSTTYTDVSPPSYAIVKTIASLENVRIEELPPLYDYVCPEALDALVRSGNSSLDITFRIMTYSVSVTGSGLVSITPR